MRARPWSATSARNPWRAFRAGWLAVACAAACSSRASAPPAPAITKVEHVDIAGIPPTSAPLAGARCAGGKSCRCREPGEAAETNPPADGMKRLEVRISADGGEIGLMSNVLGWFSASGPQEVCFYADVVAGGTQSFSFLARAASVDAGMAPRVRIAEYGAAVPAWYDVISIECPGRGGRCDRDGADAWGDAWKQNRKRGRLDPCGSMVVHQLAWDTSGGLAERDGGFFRDFTVKFDLEAKKFAPKFAPGAKECGRL